MKLWAPLLCTLGVLAGFSAGLLSTEPAFATTNYTMKVMGGASVYLNCGWHGSCKPNEETSGTALDWDNMAAHQVFFRAFMYKSSGSQSTVARGYPETATGYSCLTTWVHIASPDGGTYRGTITYMHTEIRDGAGSFAIVGSTSGYFNATQFADTTQDDICDAWTGEHLHEQAYWENATGSRNTGLYPTYPYGGTYSVSSASYYTDMGEWAY